jgi:hypothetical protein
VTGDQNGSANGPGCLGLGLLFAGVTLAATLVTMFAYILVVEQWGLIAVRREFSFDMLLYAPLTGLVVASVAVLLATRGQASPQRTIALAGISGVAGLFLLILFFGLGTIF